MTLFSKTLSEVREKLETTNATGLKKVGVALDGIKLKAIGAKVEAAALNALISFGLSYAVSAGVSAISKWVNKEKEAKKAAEEARKAAEELREQTLENAKTYEQETKELQDLISQYIKLTSSVDDVNSVKGELSNLQDQLVSKYGVEKDGIDLVNKSLEENIRLLTERQKKENEQWLRENREGIKEARRVFDIDETNQTTRSMAMATAFSITKDQLKSTYGSSNHYDEVRSEAKTLFETVKNVISEEYSDVFNNIDFAGEIQGTRHGEVYLNRFAIGIKEGLTPKQQMDAVNALVSAYEKAFNLREKNIDFFDKDWYLDSMHEWQETYQEAYDILEQVQERTSEVNVLESFEKDTETYNRYVNLLANLGRYQSQLTDKSASVADKLEASDGLRNTVSELQQIAIQYPAVADIIDSSLKGLGYSFSSVVTTFEEQKEIWLESLEEAEKGVLKNVDNITKAMATLASGEGIDSKSAWEIINLDDSNILSNIKIENDKYIFDLDQIVALKDKIIKQEIETRKESIASSRASIAEKRQEILLLGDEIEKLKVRRNAMIEGGINSVDDERRLKALNAELAKLEPQLASDKATMDALNYSMRNESLFVQELTGRLGNLADTADMLKSNLEKLKKEVSDLEKEAEARLKAQEAAIDQIIDSEEKRLEALEKEKDALEKQLDSLEKQEEEFKEIISNYEKAADVINDTIQAQLNEIEKERKTVENAYNERIDLLKQENEERSDAIEYQQKLAALENAKNNKKRIYDQERGFIYGADVDAVANAENDLANFENEQLIKSIEEERDEALKVYDAQKSDLEDYAKLWEEVVKSTTDAEDELLIQQILGSDWREKIAKKDINVLNKFKSDYTSYNNQLKNIVGTEIENIKKAVSAKEEEIKAKQEQINVWKDYKTEVQNTASTIKNGLEDYVKYLGTVQLTENSTNQQRINNLTNFTNNYLGLISQITSKNNEIEKSTQMLETLSKAGEGLMQGSTMNVSGIPNFGEELASGISSVLDSLSEAVKEIMDKTKEILTGGIGAFGRLTAFADGGVNTKTGVAWLDGTPERPELILNNTDASKLYNMLHTMPTTGINSFLFRGTNTTGNKSTVFNIQHMDINGVQNPVEFAREFKKNINEYWNTKLTESKVY